MKGRVLVVVAALTLTACGSVQAVSPTSTPSVAVTATPSPTPAPTPLPTPTPTAIPTPAPTLDLTAANDLAQVRELAATVASEQTLVRSRCSYLVTPEDASMCAFVVNQAGGYADEIPQEIQGFEDHYNLSIDVRPSIYQLQQALGSLGGAIDDELGGIQELSSTDVLEASGDVEGDAFAVAGAAQEIQDALIGY